MSGEEASKSKNVIEVLSEDNPELLQTVIREFHTTPVGGHAGVLRTFHRIAAQFYWKGMRQDIQRFIQSCMVCQRAKSSQLHPAGLLCPLPLSFSDMGGRCNGLYYGTSTIARLHGYNSCG